MWKLSSREAQCGTGSLTVCFVVDFLQHWKRSADSCQRTQVQVSKDPPQLWVCRLSRDVLCGDTRSLPGLQEIIRRLHPWLQIHRWKKGSYVVANSDALVPFFVVMLFRWICCCWWGRVGVLKIQMQGIQLCWRSCDHFIAARVLHHLLEYKNHGVPWPSTVVRAENLLPFVIKRVNEVSSLYQMFEVLGDVMAIRK